MREKGEERKTIAIAKDEEREVEEEEEGREEKGRLVK